MPFNGSGVFTRLYSWTNDAAANIKIRADRMDNETNGIVVGLSTCITKDGQTTVTANLPMANFRHTGAGAGASRTDYARLDQVQDGKLAWVDGGGTADAITASYAIPITTLVDGQECYVRATAANATTTPTFSPSALTARTIVKNGGAALVAGDIAGDGHQLILRYDLANTRWELLNPKAPNAVPFTPASSATSAYMDFAEDTDNGTNRARVIAPASLAADADITLPGVTGTLATLAGTETFTNKTATNIVLNGTLTGTAIKDEDTMTSDSATAVPTQQSVKAYVDARSGLGTAISTTSGTTHDFTGIPAGVRRVSVMFRGVSVNSTSNFLIQIGAGSITSSGYLSSADYGGASATSTAGFIVRNSTAAEAHSGIITINAIGSNAWVSGHTMRPNNGAGTSGVGTGDVALGGTLDRVRITTVAGDTFDQGTANIFWEF